MRVFLAFYKKEILECVRSGKFLIFSILFLVFGIMNPAIAKLTPWMLELISDSLAGSGVQVTKVSVDAFISWTQFFKNIPIVLIIYVFLYSGILIKEYESGTLILILTKGIPRYKIILAKLAVMLMIWTLGYFLCFGVTYVYNAYFWDNSIVKGLIPAVAYWWLFGIWVVCLILFFSVTSKHYAGVLIGTGSSVLIAYLMSLFPRIKGYSPVMLLRNTELLTGSETADVFNGAVCVTGFLCCTLVIASFPVINKKQL